MTVQGEVFERIAICTGRLAANNYFSVTQKDIDSTILEAGDELRVRVTKTNPNSSVDGPRDSDIYDATLQKSNQVFVPKSTRQKLDLETGDLLKYIVVPKKAFPGLQDGPVRDKARNVINGGTESEQETDRPERETSSAEFSNRPMASTGQVTIPAEIMDKMGLMQGDLVMATIEWQGEDVTVNKNIGTGNRITIGKDQREELGLEKGDKPKIRLAVF